MNGKLTSHHRRGIASKVGRTLKTTAATRCDSLLLARSMWVTSMRRWWRRCRSVISPEDLRDKPAPLTSVSMALENSVADKAACSDRAPAATAHCHGAPAVSGHSAAGLIRRRRCESRCSHCDSCICRLARGRYPDFRFPRSSRWLRRRRLVALWDRAPDGRRSLRVSVPDHRRHRAHDRLGPKFPTVIEDDARRPTNLDSEKKHKQRH